MQFVCIFLLLMILGFELTYDRHIYNVSIWFAGIWLFILILSSMRLLGLYESGEQTYVVITIGIVCFVSGAKLPHSIHIRTSRISFQKNSSRVNQKAYKIALIICLIALMSNVIILVRYFTENYSLGQIYQVMAMTSSGDNTELTGEVSDNMIRLQQYIGYPLLYLLVPTSIALYEDTREKKYIIVAIVLTLLRFLYDVRKTFLVMLVMWAFFIYRLAESRNIIRKELTGKEKRKKHIQTAAIIGAVVALFMYSSISRADYTSSNYSLFQNVYYYYGGCVPYLGYRLNATYPTEYTFGFTSFRGIAAPIFAALGLLGIPEPHVLTIATDNVNSLHSVITTIAPGHRYNSYATMFFQFFQDGGLVGVAIISLMYGYYAGGLQKKYATTGAIRYRVKLAYFLGTFILFSMLHFNGCVVCYVWPLLIDGLLYKNQTPSNVEESL